MEADYTLDRKNRRDHIMARLGYHRFSHLVEPGLYSLGSPSPVSPVFVTANYTLSFDALRTSIKGIDAYILVLDTKGINVWCAAGKGTFGTAEVIGRVQEAELAQVVSHRRLILPQLGAPGVSAHEVQKQTGFRVDYGPVRAAENSGKACASEQSSAGPTRNWRHDRASRRPRGPESHRRL